MPPLNWAARVRTIGRLGCRGRAAPGMHTFNDGPSATLADGFKTTEVIPMSWLERNEAPIQPEEMELEKIPKGWVLTAWPRTTKSLFFRLRLTECLICGIHSVSPAKSDCPAALSSSRSPSSKPGDMSCFVWMDVPRGGRSCHRHCGRNS